MTGTIPPALITNSPRLELLSFEATRIGGPLPANFGQLQGLKFFSATNSLLEAPLPARFWAFPLLSKLLIGGTSLSGGGSIPEEIGGLRQLTSLQLSNGGWTGTLPRAFYSLRNLTTIDLTNNSLSGTIDTAIANLPVYSLALTSNRFTGQIPASLFFSPRLQVLYVGSNNFSGCVEKPTGYPSQTICFASSNQHLCGCQYQNCSVPVCPAVPCPPPKPSNQAFCLYGQWLIGGSLIASNVTEFIGRVVVAGDLVIPSNQSSTTIALQDDGTVVIVEGCVSFAGSLNVALSQDLSVANSSLPLQLFTFESYCDDVETRFQSFLVTDRCGVVSNANLVYGSRSLSVVFGTNPTPATGQCPSEVASGLSPQTLGIIIGCTLAAVVIIAIILIILAIKIPRFRRVFTPWRRIREETERRNDDLG